MKSTNLITSPRQPKQSSATSRSSEKRKTISGQGGFFKSAYTKKDSLNPVNKKLNLGSNISPGKINFNVVEIDPKVVLTNRSSSLIVTKGSNSNLTEMEKKDSISDVTTINRQGEKNEIGKKNL